MKREDREQIKAAMKLELDPKLTQIPVYSSIESQLAHSLRIYFERGEYNRGSFTDALRCLEQAGYQLEDK